MGVFTTRQWKTSGRLVQELNVCTVSTVLENVNHVVMQCPFYNDERNMMHDLLVNLKSETTDHVMNDSKYLFYTIMG